MGQNMKDNLLKTNILSMVKNNQVWNISTLQIKLKEIGIYDFRSTGELTRFLNNHSDSFLMLKKQTAKVNNENQT